jgi:hypothetical protein
MKRKVSFRSALIGEKVAKRSPVRKSPSLEKTNNPARELLTREENIIVAKQYSFVYGDEIGIAALCDDGSKEFFTEKAHPTYREYYQIHVQDDVTLETKKLAVSEATGWTYDEEFPWIDTDSSGDALPGTDTDERLTKWLNSQIIDDYNLLEHWGSRTASQYAPGFVLMWSLSSKEAKKLQMREADLGGPASSVPCVASGASLEALNRVIAKKGLPFVFIDDEGSIED